MRGRCKHNNGCSFFLTKGRIYDIRESKLDDRFYLVEDDTGRTNAYDKSRFEVVEEKSVEIFELYFTKDGKETLYGRGSKEYVIELLNDWVVGCDMYGHDSTSFKIKRKRYKGELK